MEEVVLPALGFDFWAEELIVADENARHLCIPVGRVERVDVRMEEGVAVCPRHGARIDVRSGRALSLPAVESVRTFPVRVEDGLVLVELEP